MDMIRRSATVRPQPLALEAVGRNPDVDRTRSARRLSPSHNRRTHTGASQAASQLVREARDQRVEDPGVVVQDHDVRNPGHRTDLTASGLKETGQPDGGCPMIPGCSPAGIPGRGQNSGVATRFSKRGPAPAISRTFATDQYEQCSNSSGHIRRDRVYQRRMEAVPGSSGAQQRPGSDTRTPAGAG